jgi:tetratricopeptide (TPR) repeat protein
MMYCKPVAPPGESLSESRCRDGPCGGSFALTAAVWALHSQAQIPFSTKRDRKVAEPSAVSNLTLPEGYQPIPEEAQRKAKAFFDKAKTVADTGNFEYAIETYLLGLQQDPDDRDAHQALREVSLKRKASGGKDLGMFERGKYRGGKDDREIMLNAEKLLCFDPGNTDHLLTIAQKAEASGWFDTALWATDLCARAVADSGKTDYKKCLALGLIYEHLKQWKRAVQLIQLAAQARPDDMDLATRLKNLGALQTLDQGNYSTGGSFRESIKDSSKQQELMDADKDIRSAEGMKLAIESAERELASDPNESGKIMKLVDALVKTDDPEYESRAIEKLDQAFKRTGQFRFRARIGEITIRQMVRMERSLKSMLKSAPDDAELKKEVEDFHKERLGHELAEFRMLMENYPSEPRFRYEVAVRLFLMHQYDEAIPALQQVRQDPKFKHDAQLMLGRSFYEAGFHDEAFDTLEELINSYQLKGDDRSKEMYYWRARTLEIKEQIDPAIKSYSQVAQWDFNYRDVQKRIKELRARGK